VAPHERDRLLAGGRLGAVTMLPPLTAGLVRLSLAWVFALAVFSLAARRTRPEGADSPHYRSART
jgi:hypothetical protein